MSLAAASSGSNGAAVVVVVVVVVVAIGLYWIPTAVALVRRREIPNVGSVVVINLFLGWTVVGWVVALAMAVRSRPQPQYMPPPWQQPMPPPQWQPPGDRTE